VNEYVTLTMFSCVHFKTQVVGLQVMSHRATPLVVTAATAE